MTTEQIEHDKVGLIDHRRPLLELSTPMSGAQVVRVGGGGANCPDTYTSYVGLQVVFVQKCDLNLSFLIKMYSVMCDSNDARKVSMAIWGAALNW